MIKQRNVSYKFWIKQLFESDYVLNQEGEPNYLNIAGKNVVRVNIIATISFISSGNGYASALLDDGSASILVRAWQQDSNQLASLQLGDIVITVARIREYKGERYLIPDFVKKLEDPNWILVRKLELYKEYPNNHQYTKDVKTGIRNEEKLDYPQAPQSIGNIRQKIISSIDSLADIGGVTIDQISTFLNIDKQNIQQSVHELIKEGEVYEHKPGELKLLQ